MKMMGGADKAGTDVINRRNAVEARKQELYRQYQGVSYSQIFRKLLEARA